MAITQVSIFPNAMTDKRERPAFRMSEPPEMLHYDLLRDHRRSAIRRISGACLLIAWSLMVLTFALPNIGPASPYEVIPLSRIDYGSGNLVESAYLIPLIYCAFFFSFLSTPAAFFVTTSILMGRFYAGLMFAGMGVSLAWPFLLKVTQPVMADRIGICWALWCGSFLFASAAFLIPVLYSRYFAVEE